MLIIFLRVAYLMAIGLSLYTSGWLLMKAAKNRITKALAACQLLVIIWCLPQLFLAFPMTRGMKYMAYAISYLGISFIGPSWLEFAFLYSRRKLAVLAEVVLFAVAVINYSILLTNEYHHLFYTVFEVDRVVYGPVFYIHMAYTYACVLAGMAVMLVTFKRNRVAFSHRVVILLTAAVPLGFNLLYMTGAAGTGFDLTPPAFALSSIFMLLAVFRYDFLDVNTMAFERIFDTILEGVAVYNRRGKITYCNEAARDWFGLFIGGEVQRAWDMLEGFNKAGMVMTLDDAHENRKLEIRQYDCCDSKGNRVAGTLMFTDVSRYYQLLDKERELAVSNQMLAIEQERNRIAQEVHDTTGHTLTMIHSLLKLIRIECGTNSGEAKLQEYLAQAEELAGSGIRELRCSINNLRQEASWGLITQGVRRLAASVKEFEVEVVIQGEDRMEYSYLSPVVYECLREAVTNCLKYANASHMDVILKFGGSLNLYIFDNGQGCRSIEEGNGMRGIRRRVELAGGRVKILSETGEGFQIYISLPLQKGEEDLYDKSSNC